MELKKNEPLGEGDTIFRGVLAQRPMPRWMQTLQIPCGLGGGVTAAAFLLSRASDLTHPFMTAFGWGLLALVIAWIVVKVVQKIQLP